MSKPANIIKGVNLRINQIETDPNNPLFMSNTNRIDFQNGSHTNQGNFSQLVSETKTGAILTPQNLINTTGAPGTITIPANSSQIGDTYDIYASGNFTSALGRILKIDLKLGNIVVATTGLINMALFNNAPWEMNAKLVIRQVGAVGVAVLSTTGILTGATSHISLNLINNTTFTTITALDFVLEATWSNLTTVLDIITLDNFIIRKIY